MKRGEVRVVDLDPVRGSEANNRRPAVIVSNDGANSTAERIGLRQDSKAQAEQVRSVAVERIGGLVGELPPDLVAALDEALRLHLAL